MADCLPHDVLDRALAGDFHLDEMASVDAHVRECGHCQAVLDRETDHLDLRPWLDARRRYPVVELDAKLLGRMLDRFRTPDPSHEEADGAAEEYPAARGGRSEPPARLGTIGTFRLLDELGRGGMGIVYRAWDEPLRRLVALKVLRPDQSRETDRRRLVREAQLASSFRHDHAVLIHGVVDPPDGLPYLVMEYVPGPTLAQLIAADPRPGFRQIVTYVAPVADALHAAHAAGLVHRDVKPGNILIDEETGRAKISDFGLARVQEGQSRLTQQGFLAGTPAYMSPEQAGGEPRLDGRADVYSLGLTLYEALTGTTAYRGAPHMVLRQVIEGEPALPRRLNDAIPPDLETICLKAIAKEPHRRYQTAQAMADDLRRWLNGEPIVARPAGTIERLWRWCRRKPVVASLTAALISVLVLGFGGIAWQWQRAEGNAMQAHAKADEAERERLQAEANLHHARELSYRALEALSRFNHLTEPELYNRSGLQTLRRKLLHEVVEDLGRFLAQWPEDARLQSWLGKCLLELGVTTGQTGKFADALKAHRHSRALLNKGFPDAPYVGPNMLATNDLYIGWLSYQMGRFDEALDSLGRARDTWNEIVEERPNDHWYRRNQSLSYCTTAEVHLALERPDDALQWLKKARAVAVLLVQEQPGDDRYTDHLAYVDYLLGTLHHACGRWSKALESLQQAHASQQEVVRATPADIWRQRSMGRIEHLLGLVYLAKMQFDQSQAHLERARTVFQKLCRDDAEVTDFQSRLASTQLAVGQLHSLRGEWPEARRCFSDGCDRHGRLLRDNPEMVFCQMEVVESYIGLSRVERETGELDLALRYCEKADSQLQRLTLEPERAAHQYLRGEILSCFAQVWWQQGRHAQALAASQEAVTAGQNAVSKAPQQVWFRQAARDHATWLAALQREE
jgi:serine/threonine-protein kinase